MPDVARVLKEEISRIARKEAKALMGPIAKQVRGLRRTVREQEKLIGELEARLAGKVGREQQGQTEAGSPEVGAEASIRIAPASIKSNRDRLGLSQKELGLLLGVSALTVSRWETGKAAPRVQNRLALGGMRKMGVRDARAGLG